MTALKPCPFCGCADIENDLDDSVMIFCSACGASQNSIEAWNMRPGENAAIMAERGRTQKDEAKKLAICTKFLTKIYEKDQHAHGTSSEDSGTHNGEFADLAADALIAIKHEGWV